MKQLLLATTLIAVPVAGFAGFQLLRAHDTRAVQVAAPVSLGDMSAFTAIIADVQAIAAKGDLAAAEKRITDYEGAWDEGQARLRPLNSDAWRTIDDASDAAIHALRAATPKADEVTATLAALQTALTATPAAATASGGVTLVSGIAVTDGDGHNIPCEQMIAAVRTAVSTGKIDPADAAIAADLQTKATERCNADDDLHADAFSAQALALAAH